MIIYKNKEIYLKVTESFLPMCKSTNPGIRTSKMEKPLTKL